MDGLQTIDDVFISILARTTCQGMDCDDCKKYYNCDDCPSGEVDTQDQIDLARKLYEHMKEGKFYTLGKLPWDDRQWSFEDILEVINDCTA